MSSSKTNIYMPSRGRVMRVRILTPDVKLYCIKAAKTPKYRPGQFYMLSLWGYGEVPISVCGISSDECIEFTIRKAGFVTTALHHLSAGDTIWLRGPYGNGFPMELAIGRDVIIVAGGIGLAPLRAVLQWLIHNRHRVGHITLLYGAKEPDSLLYRNEYELWQKNDIKVVLTVDRPTDGWKGNVGVVTTLWHEVQGKIKDSVAYICGPPVMIRATMIDLFHLGMPDERIITTLEAHMKCGVGKCGHCYNGRRYICTDGPVFSYSQIKREGLSI